MLLLPFVRVHAPQAAPMGSPSSQAVSLFDKRGGGAIVGGWRQDQE